jgi:hypothetical protein
MVNARMPAIAIYKKFFMNLFRSVRFYSTKLWIKRNGYQSIQVPTEGCITIADFKEKVKLVLSNWLSNFNSGQITIHRSNDDEPFEPDELLESISSSAKTPLIVSTISKTVFIVEVDEDQCPTDEFTEVTVENDADIYQIIGLNGEALYELSEPNTMITKFWQLKNNGKYNIYSRRVRAMSQELRWKQKENKPIERESWMSMQNYLLKNLGSSVKQLPNEIRGIDGDMKQNWDAVFLVDDDALYFCVAKNVMTLDNMRKIPVQLKEFRELQPLAQPEFQKIKKVYGVVCTSWVPELVQQEARKEGLICVSFFGYRHYIDKHIPKEFQIVR